MFNCGKTEKSQLVDVKVRMRTGLKIIHTHLIIAACHPFKLEISPLCTN